MATVTAILDSKIIVLAILSFRVVWWPKLDIGTECFFFFFAFVLPRCLAASFGSMIYGSVADSFEISGWLP